MYDPKGGDKPAYDPPAETKPPAEPPTYQKPPTEEPPYQKPPVEEPPPEEPPQENPYEKPPGEKPPDTPPTCEPPTGDCSCKEWPVDSCPADSEPFRRLLQKLEDILEELAEKPTDATKKFADDLTDADKEYQGVIALVTKYKEFYDKLDCKLAEAKSWKEDIDDWLAGKLNPGEAEAIKSSWTSNYDDKARQICCDWIHCHDLLSSMTDCLEQAKRKEDEAKDNYEAIKNFEKTLGDRFAELKTLFDKAKALRDEERYKAVYAVSLEYDDVYTKLGLIRDWFYARAECKIETGESSACPTSPSEPTTGDLKKDWTPDKFKAELVRRLRLLIAAKYQRFRWQHDFLSRASENQKKKEACEKFRKERRDKFIQEADDIPPAQTTEPGGGGGTGKPGYGDQTPTDQYPGENPENPPPPQYPPGQNPEYPQTPEQQYPTGQTPGYPETPPPTDKYRGRQKS